MVLTVTATCADTESNMFSTINHGELTWDDCVVHAQVYITTMKIEALTIRSVMTTSVNDISAIVDTEIVDFFEMNTKYTKIISI